jgi:hypothetical protein
MADEQLYHIVLNLGSEKGTKYFFAKKGTFCRGVLIRKGHKVFFCKKGHFLSWCVIERALCCTNRQKKPHIYNHI